MNVIRTIGSSIGKVVGYDPMTTFIHFMHTLLLNYKDGNHGGNKIP